VAVDIPVAAEPGDPLPGLSDAERASFLAGLALFNHNFTPAQGLGPFFNEDQCSACHTDPVSGGTGEQFAIRATIFTEPDACDMLVDFNGENVQTNATPLLRARGITNRPMPPHATHISAINVPFLFGNGLLEAIPDEALLERAAAGRGRVGRDAEGRVARFGRKAEHATLESFIAGALLHEMGLTSPVHPNELPFDGGPLPPEFDPAPDPELSAAQLAQLVAFVRFLAPLPRIVHEDPEQRALAERGERVFHDIGCAECHVPYLDTGRSDSPALDRKRVYLYSDLLLHDMGPERAGACGVAARPSELRTEPLTGLRWRRLFMHDSRAFSLGEAIDLHGGEATAARTRFQTLGDLDRELLLIFLRTL
jgi:CxxC motif-containing protein (DUF1111 family)